MPGGRRSKLDHLSYVGTSAILFAAINWMKVPSYLALGTLNRTTLTMAAILMPLAIGSTFAGVWLVRRIDAARFYAIIYWLMVALGLRLVWQGLA